MHAIAIAACRAGTLLLALAACSSPPRRPPPPRPASIDAGSAAAPSGEPRLVIPEDTAAPAGGTPCTRNTECADGQQCRGPSGCSSGWACGEARECMTEVVAYCGCDATTFHAPGGCPGQPYAHLGPCEEMGERIAAGTEFGMPAWDEPIVSDERLCTSSADCSRGRICWGVPGCATDWSCVRARGCARDSVPYCGCDGETFHASSNCPGRPYLHRGACREAIAAVPSDGSGRNEGAGRAGAASAAVLRDAGVIGRGERASGAATSAAPLPPGACRSQRDCRRGHVCQGPPGCGVEGEWRCGPPERECIRDTQVFCACDGRDFRASMFCPGRPYRHRGSCEIDRLIELSGAVVR